MRTNHGTLTGIFESAPGCVPHGLLQAQRVATRFPDIKKIIGFHTVFEYYEAMGLASIRKFLHEYGIHFPVAVDLSGPDGDPLPPTLRANAMQGTPTTVLIDTHGRFHRQVFGVHDELLLGADLGLVRAHAPSAAEPPAAPAMASKDSCT